MFLPGCTPLQAAKIIELRPFYDVDDLNTKLGQGRKKAGPGGISPRMFEDCITIFEGYGMVDGILEDCEEIGASLRDAIASWTSSGAKRKGKRKEDSLASGVSSRGSPAIGQIEDGALSLLSLEAVRAHATKDFIATQPSSLKEGTVLKDYQLLGVNWLNLLYRQDLSCILADEMGA
jgi:SWI/SNF-related matrix-associated actin-dependent regulator 1 of chromatin subfamily A